MCVCTSYHITITLVTPYLTLFILLLAIIQVLMFTFPCLISSLDFHLPSSFLSLSAQYLLYLIHISITFSFIFTFFSTLSCLSTLLASLSFLHFNSLAFQFPFLFYLCTLSSQHHLHHLSSCYTTATCTFTLFQH